MGKRRIARRRRYPLTASRLNRQPGLRADQVSNVDPGPTAVSLPLIFHDLASKTTDCRAMTGATSSGDPGPSTMASRRLPIPPKQSQVDAEDLDDALVGMLGERVEKSLANFRVSDLLRHENMDLMEGGNKLRLQAGAELDAQAGHLPVWRLRLGLPEFAGVEAAGVEGR